MRIRISLIYIGIYNYYIKMSVYESDYLSNIHLDYLSELEV